MEIVYFMLCVLKIIVSLLFFIVGCLFSFIMINVVAYRAANDGDVRP